jgi:N-acetylglucosaminyldiphosphoundecaprenol N-acetyl-beta-D-mannosaminyltransferase
LSAVNEPVWVWGVPFAPLKLQEAIETVATLVKRAEPAFFITANTHYAMLSKENPDLREINNRAAFIVADGAPLVWAARRFAVPLPERVAGSDMIYSLCEMASREGYRVFLAGGAPGVADVAAKRLRERFPALQVVGTASPSFHEFSGDDLVQLKTQLDAVQPHLLIVAATMPVGERWLAKHLSQLQVPVGVNLGAAIDFAAGRVDRAPKWMQRSGLEWAFRLKQEPRRLFSRYVHNALFLLTEVLRDLSLSSHQSRATSQAVSAHPPDGQR